MEKAKILIAEDEKTQRDLLEGFLKKEGFSVEAAANGREAIQKLEGDFFDIVFLDYKMPELDGLQTLREIRRRYPGPSGGDDDRLRNSGNSRGIHERGSTRLSHQTNRSGGTPPHPPESDGTVQPHQGE